MFYSGWFAATQWQWLLSGIARGRSRARCIRLADRLTRVGAHFCPIRVELLSHATEKSNMFVVRKINIQQFDNRLLLPWMPTLLPLNVALETDSTHPNPS